VLSSDENLAIARPLAIAGATEDDIHPAPGKVKYAESARAPHALGNQGSQRSRIEDVGELRRRLENIVGGASVTVHLVDSDSHVPMVLSGRDAQHTRRQKGKQLGWRRHCGPDQIEDGDDGGSTEV
jgi:hypothetical protein